MADSVKRPAAPAISQDAETTQDAEKTSVTAAAAEERPRRALLQSLNPHRNSLNFLRLCLALTVVVSHVIAVTGSEVPNTLNHTYFGQIAVYGFFGLSGYLITGSALRNSLGRFLWQRCLRILPAFWLTLVITAFGFGSLVYLTHGARACSLECYYSSANGPVQYLYRNALLVVQQQDIAGTPGAGPYHWIWNGSLWTLSYEFACYLLVASFAIIGFLRHRLMTLAMTVVLWGTVATIGFTPSLAANFNLFHNLTPMLLMRLTCVFLVGATVYLYRERIPDSPWLAMICFAVFIGGLCIPSGSIDSQYYFTRSSVLVPFITYPLLWLGAHLPFHRIGSRNDYSYGIYLFGFPAMQIFVVWGGISWGVLPLVCSTVLVTVALAIGSWWLVERRALALKRFNLEIAALRRSKQPNAGSTSRGVTDPEAFAVEDLQSERAVVGEGRWTEFG